MAIRDYYSAQAAICLDSNDSIVKAISQISPPCDLNYGEALAARLAASLVLFLHLKSFSLEGNSYVVIMAHQFPSIVQD
jgi:hypothetical protein